MFYFLRSSLFKLLYGEISRCVDVWKLVYNDASYKDESCYAMWGAIPIEETGSQHSSVFRELFTWWYLINRISSLGLLVYSIGDGYWYLFSMLFVVSQFDLFE